MGTLRSRLAIVLLVSSLASIALVASIDVVFQRLADRHEQTILALHQGAPAGPALEQARADEAASRRLRSVHLVLSVAVTQALLAGALWLLSGRLLLRPTQRLWRSMRQVAQGDLGVRAELQGPREVADLAAQLNDMLDNLQETRRRLDLAFEERMTRADRLATMGELATAISHEIKNPLAGLSGALQILRADPALAGRREIMDEMLATLGRLDRTVEDLLDYGRPSRPAPSHCDVNQQVSSALGLIRQQREVREAHIAVEVLPEVELPPVQADPQAVQQVLLNVLLNAVQAMPAGGRLRVETRRERRDLADCVHVRVSDTGVGIAEKDLARVFQPFFTTKHRGTGLGMAISKRLVESAGGCIHLDSHLGRGTSVDIGFPASPEHHCAARTTEDAARVSAA
ncbi:MAG TPA: ATP-binding protein [Myxococcota bacterium]|nr:ATP-binding protein [Myxococcota bacterium]HRY95398.1 ATP-binding protein [Myxococcota bacterium]HSA21512.1 ATP-binding protein [Myxococcota bacterium]